MGRVELLSQSPDHGGATESWIIDTTVRNALRENHRNLRIGVNHPTGTTEPTDVTVDVTADYITVEGVGLSSINLTCDLSTSGAGGLDTGSIANSTWYYLYLIASSRAEIYALLASASATAPTMPAGYHLKRLIGAIRTNGSAKLYRFYFIEDGWFIFNEDLTASPFYSAIAATTTWTTVAQFFPVGAQRVMISAEHDRAGAAGTCGVAVRPLDSNWAYGSGSLLTRSGGTTKAGAGGNAFPLGTNRQFQIRSQDAVGEINWSQVGFWMEV